MKPTLILFTKAPRWGTVKSRLAARIGPMAALRFHRAQVGRMIRALGRTGGPAVLIGSDIPGVTPAHIARAFALLRRADVVFGPAEDGGFWLLGLRRPMPMDVFAGVRWSTEETLAQCLNRMGGRVVTLGDCLADVDDVLDI